MAFPRLNLISLTINTSLKVRYRLHATCDTWDCYRVEVETNDHTRDGRPAPPRPAPRKKGCPAPPRKKASLAPPRENWQNLRGGAGQSLFESLEN